MKAEDMRYLKKNRYLVAVGLLIAPAFFFDRDVILWVKNFYDLHPAVFRLALDVDPFIGFISNGGTLIAMAVIMVAAGRLYRRSLYAPGKALFFGLVTAGIGVQIIKHLAGRARPRLTCDTVFVGPTFENGYDSFPSGHTTIAFCLACILSAHYPRYRVFFYLFAVLVALYRIQGFNHFPSDVLAGVVVGTVAGSFFVRRDAEVGR